MKNIVAKLTALCALFVATSATAHSLYVVAQYDGQKVSGKSYYSDMTPAAETYVEAYKSGENQPAVSGKTDATGHFQLALNSDGDVKVVVEGEEGHRASIMADRISMQSAQSDNSNAFALLREDISELKNKLYLQNILGGVGYIVGFFGLWAWFVSRRSNRSNKKD